MSVGAEYDGYPNGLKFLAGGTALIADLKNGIMKFDPARGTVEPYLTRRLLEPFRGCNDLCVAKNGDVYFTDQAQSSLADAYGRVYCLRAATGKLDLVLDKIPSPNGLVLNKAENALYHVVQESLRNVYRHAHCDAACITLRGGKARAELRVADTGCGLPAGWNATSLDAAFAGVGIASMRQRVLNAHGTFDIESSGNGTTVVAAVPVWASRRS